jgi:hypothetical protein
MPKVSQSRRHTYRKHHEQSPATLIPEFSADSITLNRTTPRKVSEEDINSCTSDNNISSDKSLRPIRPKGQLKRPIPSVCLSDLASTNASISRRDSTTESCLSRTSSFPEESDMTRGDAYYSSPWGHFVDLLVSSSSDEGLGSDGSSCAPRSFLPSHYCPDAPYKLYPSTPNTKRRRFCSHARPSPVTHNHHHHHHHHQQQPVELSSALSGLNLSSRPSSTYLLKAAQDALNDCRL